MQGLPHCKAPFGAESGCRLGTCLGHRLLTRDHAPTHWGKLRKETVLRPERHAPFAHRSL